MGKTSTLPNRFFLLVFPCIVASYFIRDAITIGHISLNTPFVLFFLLSIVVSITFYFKQKNSLRFQVYQYSGNRDNIFKILEELATRNDWTIEMKSYNAFIAETNPGFFSGSWGEQVTILFNEKNIYLNSICSLNKKASIASYGRNKANVQLIVESLQENNIIL